MKAYVYYMCVAAIFMEVLSVSSSIFEESVL